MRRTRWFSVILVAVAVTGAAADSPVQQGGFRLLLDVNGALPVVTMGQRVTAVVSNASPVAVEWQVRIVGKETFGETFAVPEFKCALQPGAVRRMELPPSPAKGCWRVVGEASATDGSTLRDERRYAVMDAHPITPVVEDGSFRVGVHVHCGRYPQALSDRVVEAVARTGAKLVRTDYAFMFADVYPTGPDAAHWERADCLLKNIRDHGLALDAIIYGNPEWATIPELKAIKGGGIWSVATKPGVFGRFAGEMATRYGTRIAYYEIGNELDAFPANKLPPREMLRIQREAYEAIKKVAPDAKVIPCGWASGGTRTATRRPSGSRSGCRRTSP